MLTNSREPKNEYTSVRTGSLSEDESKTMYELSDIGGE